MLDSNKDEPILTNTDIFSLSESASLKEMEFLGANGNIYHRIELYYTTTGEKIDLGLIHYEDPDHLNMVERVIYSKSYYVVIRKNLATGEITSYSQAFDIRNKIKIYDQSQAKIVYEKILIEKTKTTSDVNSHDPVIMLLNGTSKAIKFLFGNKNS